MLVFPGGGLFTRSGSEAHPLFAEELSRVPNGKNSDDVKPTMTGWLKKIAILKREDGIDRLRETYESFRN